MDNEQNTNGFHKKDQVCFNRLPEQIREHYPNLNHFGQVWLNEAHALLEFYPGGDRDEIHTHFWEKTTSGWHQVGKEILAETYASQPGVESK
jgi:hypothetical protein